MQDIHSIGGAGRLFGGGDRRLRPHHHHHQQQQHHQNNQALKCPRCDSLNTKFCYYNNYNLSQPRHFCKSCRRYWTKGGVLRNVPVGGGCRKTKRSKPKQNAASAAAAAAAATVPIQAQPPPPQQQQRELKSSNSHSSSESSSLTAATNTATGNTALEAVSAYSSNDNNNNSNNKMLSGFGGESKLFANNGNLNPSFETALLEQGTDCGIFSDIGSFTSLITASGNEPMAFGDFGGILSQQQTGLEHVHPSHQVWQPHNKMVGLSAGDEIAVGAFMDQTVQDELLALQDGRSSGNGGFGAFDWQGVAGGDHHQHQSLYDLPNAVDHAYWTQNQWSATNDQDHPSLYLP